MKRISTLIASILLSTAAFGGDIDTDAAIEYQAGGQYTAVLNTGNSHWRLLPGDGHDFAIQLDKNCPSSVSVPTGLWLLTRDADGKPELLAPSQTQLPTGHSGHIAVAACDQARADELALPASLIEWLGANTGAVYVE